jgi:type II secretory pathway component PulF
MTSISSIDKLMLDTRFFVSKSMKGVLHMTKKQKAKLMNALMAILALFFFLVLLIPQFSVSATSPAWWIETHSFFANLGSNFKDNWMLYVFVLVLIYGAIKYSKKK